jgi:hypothetical protein
MTFIIIISFLPTVSFTGVPYLAIGVLGVVADKPFLKLIDGVVDVLFLVDGVGNFILATSPGPGGRSTSLGALRLEFLRLRRGVSVDIAREETGDGNGGGEESGEEDGERICVCGIGAKGLGGGGMLERK